MNSDQFARWLRKQGVIVGRPDSKNHRSLHNPATGKYASLPTHGGRQQLKKGTMEGIKKQLGLK